MPYDDRRCCSAGLETNLTYGENPAAQIFILCKEVVTLSKVSVEDLKNGR